MLIILPYLQLAAGHAGCYGLQGRFISKNSLFSYSDDISSRYPDMLKDIPSCIRLLTDLRSKIHQYVPCGIPCNAHLETCGFSPASAGAENATAGSEASRSTKDALQRSLTLTPPPAATLSSLPCKSPYGSLGRMAFFPSFSWSGKCDSSGGKPPTLTLQQATACLLSVLPSGSPMALRAKRHGLKSCGSRMGLSAICFANRDKSPSEASQSDEGALQHSLRSFLRLRLRLEAYPSEFTS